MTNPALPGYPIPAGITAAIDETVVDHRGGVIYVLVAALFVNAKQARQAIQELTCNRQRPFHWRKEGPTLRVAAADLLQEQVVATHLLARQAGRRQQVVARRKLLARLVVELANDGVDHVIIESQGTDLDGRDRNTILDSFRAGRADHVFTYEWRTKTEPLLWYPDALAGIVHGCLAGRQAKYFRQLQKARVVTEILYVADPLPGNA